MIFIIISGKITKLKIYPENTPRNTSTETKGKPGKE